MTANSSAARLHSISPPPYASPMQPDTVTATQPIKAVPSSPAPRPGPFSGALGWPVPLSAEQQRIIENLVDRNTAQLEGLPLIMRRHGALGYLLQGRRLSPLELRDPAKALELLLDTPRARALGKAIESALAGFPNATRREDYVLAAIQIGLDPESMTAPGRSTVAGYNLAQNDHWGKPASAVINGLSRHLEGERRSEAGDLAARLLLARVAPQFLLKDIPDHVVYGSHAWATLSILVARQEAHVPGSAKEMTYPQLLETAENLAPPASEAAQRAALIDWGVCNGYLRIRNDEHYGKDELNLARTAFNEQLDQMKAASGQLDIKLPSRKAMALAVLKQAFPDIDQRVFEIRGLSIKDRAFNPGSRSMLDIVMEGNTLGPSDLWETRDRRIPIDAFNTWSKTAAADIAVEFEPALNRQKDLHATLVKQLVARLPLEDRTRFANGKLEFFKENTYAPGLLSDTLERRKNSLLVKIQHNKKDFVYELDPEHGLIRERPLLEGKIPSSRRFYNMIHKVERFTPKDNNTAHLREARVGDSYRSPQSFSSERTRHIADAYVEALGLDAQSRGLTSFDKERGQQEGLKQFLLDLIPLRSAINNFQDGNYGAGLTDLAIDIFGFVTAGLGAGAKVVKASSAAVSGVQKALKVARILGATAISELNPVSGVTDVIRGTANVIGKGANFAVERYRSLFRAADGADLLAASKKHGIAASGELLVGDARVETIAVFHEDRWYHYDPVTQKPYGPPLDYFTPASWAQSNTLMPASRTSSVVGNHRYNPVALNSYPPFPPTIAPTLPQKTDHLMPGEYLKNTQAKEVHAHFTPSRLGATRQKFLNDMSTFYIPATVPATRPPLPVLNGSTAPNDLIEKALDQNNTLVFGESHQGMSSFQTLYDAMDTFQAKGVRSFFCEGLLPKSNGGWRDAGLGTVAHDARTPGKFPTLADLLKKAELNGIKVIPLEHYWLTKRKDVSGTYHNIRPDTALSKQRLEEFNYFATRTIEQHANGGKSVVLVGRSHMMTCEGVPGIAELTNGIGIGIYEGSQTIASKSTYRIPNPNQSLQKGDMAGDFQIFRKVV